MGVPVLYGTSEAQAGMQAWLWERDCSLPLQVGGRYIFNSRRMGHGITPVAGRLR